MADAVEFTVSDAHVGQGHTKEEDLWEPMPDMLAHMQQKPERHIFSCETTLPSQQTAMKERTSGNSTTKWNIIRDT